ncbi:MAG: hypothetical protein FWD48_01225 [Oscillospiraceae bacterium]|nr:hypothetical protein [Oscillospiraceae bacterium]
MQKITQQEVKNIKNYLYENKVHSYPCNCGSLPRIIVERTTWGTPVIIMKCQNCKNTSSAIGTTHIDALNKALNHWNHKQERITLMGVSA